MKARLSDIGRHVRMIERIIDLQAELARMRPVYRAVMRCVSAEGWIMDGEHIACKPDAIRRLEDACARAKRKIKARKEDKC